MRRVPKPCNVEISSSGMQLIKTNPKNIDIIRRELTSVITYTSISTILHNVTIMPFKIIRRVYGMAPINAPIGRHTIISLGAGRFQEINEMKNSHMFRSTQLRRNEGLEE